MVFGRDKMPVETIIKGIDTAVAREMAKKKK